MKHFITLVFALFFFQNSLAQEQNIGFKLGINRSNLNGDLGEDASGKTGFHGGLFFESRKNNFALSLELLYSNQGLKFGDNSDNDGSLTLEYINLPVIAKYFLIENITLEAGPQLGILASAKSTSNELNDVFKDFDFGVNFGVGFRTNTNICFGIRYYMGIEDVLTGTSFSNVSGKNRVLQFSVGYLFD